MKSQRSNSKYRSSVAKDDEIDEIISNITLKRPRNAYTQYVLSELEKFRKKNKDKKIELPEFNRICASNWKKLSDGDKGKFEKAYEDDKQKYKKDLETVKHYLFKDYTDTKKGAPTAYRMFLNEKMREGFDKGEDPKDVKKEAKEEWSKMSEKEKKVYFDRKKDNDDWFSKAKKINRVTALSVFIQKTIEAAKNNHKEPPALKDIAPSWKKLSTSEKRKYEQYAEEINEEKKQMRDIFELTHGVKPSRPLGAYKIFLQEKAKNDELKSIQHGRDLWEKLSQDEKDEYLVKAHKLKIAYIYKKMIYKKRIKKLMPKRPGGPVQQFLKEKKGQKPANGESFLTYFRNVYENLSASQKQKYEEKAEKAKERYEKRMKDFEDKVFDLPKKARSGFALYIKDRMPDLRDENKNKTNAELLKVIAKEWKEEKVVDQDKYNRQSQKDQKRFKKQLKEFEKYGYYTKSGAEKTADEDEEDEKSSKRSSRKSSKSSKKSTKKKSASRSKSTKKGRKSGGSKSKTQETRSRSKSKKGKSTRKK